MSEEHEDHVSCLVKALKLATQARACIAQNQGYDKELAREGYEHVISMEVWPALITTLENVEGVLPARSCESLAREVVRRLKNHNPLKREI
jgi:hypothetical protein